MKTSLELFHLNAGKYPLPDEYETVDYEGEDLWYQGNFGEDVISSLSRNLSEVPTDPLTGKKYIYSVANNKNEFEILTLFESDVALNTITQTNAASLTVTPKVDGTYNGVFIKTATHIVPTPSVITSENIGVGVGLTLDNTNIKSQVVNGGKNIPNVGNVNNSTGELPGLELSVYTGSITKDDDDTKKEEIMLKIQAAYTASELANDDIYKYILSISGTENLAGVLDTVVLGDSTTIVASGNDTPAYNNQTVLNCVNSGDVIYGTMVDWLIE